MADFHKSVLLAEAITLLQVQKGKKYIDATLGGGGHLEAILGLGGEVLGIDQDKEAIQHVQGKLNGSDWKLVQGNFKYIDDLARSNGFSKVAGVIFDLGVSSRQIDEPKRGFSYQKVGPLDMRMNQDEKSPKAKDFLNLASKDEIFKIFNQFGEEPRAFALAQAVVRARQIRAFETTSDLLKIIDEVYGVTGRVSDKTRASMAKRVFQALRIAVNSELESLEIALPKAVELLEENGRLLVISFHSLEDRIVKRAFLKFEKEGLGRVQTKTPIVPGSEEQKENPRARSAKLRVFERN